MKKLLAIILTIAIIMALTTGCANSETPAETTSGSSQTETKAETKNYKIGVSMGFSDQTYNQFLLMGLMNKLKEGDEMFVSYHEWNLENQISQIEDFVANKVDIIIISMSDPDGILPALQTAKDAGIPVVEFDCPSNYFDKGLTLAQVISDDYQGGYECGKALAKGIGEKGVVLSYVVTSTVNSQKRLAGFKDAIAEYPNIKHAYNATDVFDAVTSQSVIENMLLANPDATGLFTSNSKIAMAAVNCLKSNGYKPGQIKLTHVDSGTKNDVYTWLQEGYDYAAYNQQPVLMAETTLDIAYDILKNNGDYSDKSTIIPGQMVYAGEEYINEVTIYKTTTGSYIGGKDYAVK